MAENRCEAAGCDLLRSTPREIAEVGIVEVIKHIPTIYRRFRQVVRDAERRRPDAAVLIDFPDFNLRLARELHQRGIPVIYYVSPQLWAWKQRRIERVRKYVREMLVIFPFEEKFYRERGIPAHFVGHPLADLPAPKVTREQFAAEYKLDPDRQWIALLPGSRRGEVSRILPPLLQAAQLLDPDYVYPTVPVALPLSMRNGLASFLRGYSGPPITFTRDARATLLHARVAAVASGTSTLEAALIGTPFAMVYQVAPLTWTLGRRLVKVDRFAMVNLIARNRMWFLSAGAGGFHSHSESAPTCVGFVPEGQARATMIAEFHGGQATIGFQRSGRECIRSWPLSSRTIGSGKSAPERLAQVSLYH